jgi:nucleotide-binding universal stress UspA family protein
VAYKSVVVGTDGSARAAVALRTAAEMAKAAEARLTVVVAFSSHPREELARAQRDAPSELQWMMTDSAQAEELAGRARTTALEAGVKDVKSRVVESDPADAIIGVAEDVNADLIVVGNKGMTSATRFVLGSVPNKVSHHSPCDLFIVHTGN